MYLKIEGRLFHNTGAAVWNIIKKSKISCKLVPVQYREYEYGISMDWTGLQLATFDISTF